MNKSLYIDIPEQMYADLREYCFKHNTTKRKVVINALGSLLIQKAATATITSPVITTVSTKLLETPKLSTEELAERLRQRAAENKGQY